MSETSPGAQFRAAVAAEKPLQVVGAITAYAGLMARHTGYRALYLSGGGVAANSLGLPDLGISTMDDVLCDARRIVDASGLPLLVDIDTGWGGAFNIARTIRSFERVGVAAVHLEDQVGQKRCGHRPGKEVVACAEMVDRIKAAVDARRDPAFVIMARTDALAGGTDHHRRLGQRAVGRDRGARLRAGALVDRRQRPRQRHPRPGQQEDRPVAVPLLVRVPARVRRAADGARAPPVAARGGRCLPEAGRLAEPTLPVGMKGTLTFSQVNRDVKICHCCQR